MDDYAKWVLAPSLPVRPARAKRSYFVCGVPRCGSWLLCGLLASVGVAGRPHEYFAAVTERPNRARWNTPSLRDYIERVLDAGTTDNGVFACKIMWNAMSGLLERLELEHSSFEDAFPAPRFVWLIREDVAAQAVSWAKALQTGHWHYWDPPPPAREPEFDAAAIAALARQITDDNEAWRQWFRRNGIEPFVVRFEELVADKQGTARRVLDFLELELPSGVDIGEQTTSTGDAVNEAWLSRYRSDGG